MERVQHGDGFGQLIADRVRVAAERVQRGGFDAGGEAGTAVFEPADVGLPGPSRNKVQQSGVHHTLGVTGVVHDAGDHAGSRWTGVGPDMLIDAERVQPRQSASRCDSPGGLCLDRVPGGVPGHAELVGQGRDRGVEMLQAVGRPRHGPGGEFCPGPRQLVLFGERGSRAVRVRAAPHTLGPQQPHRTAEALGVMEPDLPAAVSDRDDAAVRTAANSFGCLDVQNQAGPGRRDRAGGIPSTPRSASARSHQRPPGQEVALGISGSLFIWKLGRYQFKEALASFLPHHAATSSGHAPAPGVRGPQPRSSAKGRISCQRQHGNGACRASV